MIRRYISIFVLLGTIQRGFAQDSSSDPGGGKSIVETVKAGSDVILNCATKAADSGTKVDLIEWRKNGTKSAIFVKFMNFKPHVDTKYSRRLHVVNETAILISNIELGDAGIYRCKTMSSGGSETVFSQGTAIVLKVQVPPFFRDSPLDRVTAAEGSSVKLPCIAGGSPEPQVEWYRLDGELPAQRSILTEARAGAWLTLTALKVEDAGFYQCTAFSIAGSLHSVTKLTVERTSNVLPSRRKTVTEKYPAVLDCQTDSALPSGNVVFSWTKDGVTLATDSRVTKLTSGALFIRSARRTDSGVYKCTAKTFDSSGLVIHKGVELLLEVQFPPSIINFPLSVMASETSDARLPCKSIANPPTLSTNWTRDGKSVTSFPRFAVLEDGTLLITSVMRSDMGQYQCTPSNIVGSGRSKSTVLIVNVVPKFITAPPSIMTVRVGDDVTMICAAVSEKPMTLSWTRDQRPFPEGRTWTKEGNLTIKGVKREDFGGYSCTAATKKGKAVHRTMLAVISTPSRPKITSVQVNGTTATVFWRPGYDGGHPQVFEVWYRVSKDADTQWGHSDFLPASVTSYRVSEMREGEVYHFSVRAVNKEGAGHFSEIVQAGGAVVSPGKPLAGKPGKPVPPHHVIVNITSAGYYVSWRYSAIPGRASPEKFVVEYKKDNESTKWLVLDGNIPATHRVYLLRAKIVEPDVTYFFRVFAFGGNLFSDAAYVSQTYIHGEPVLAKRSGTDIVPIVAGVLAAVFVLVLIALVYFCYAHNKSKKTVCNKTAKKVHFVLPDGSDDHCDRESDDDFCDAEIRLRPETVRFIPDDSEGSEDEKLGKRRKEDDLITLTSHDGHYPGSMLRCVDAVVGLPGDTSPVGSPCSLSPPLEKVHFFKDGWEERNGWYDCTLAESVSREVRDSYDQFVKVSNDDGSRDSLNKSHQGKRLYEQMGSKMFLVSRFDSNSSLPGYPTLKRGKGLGKGTRREAFQGKDLNLKYARQQPHHWSTPAVFTRNGESRNSRSSDSDSGDSLPREKKIPWAVRPQSLYDNNALSARAELKPITEQDSDPSLRCACEEDEIEESTCHIAERKDSDDSTYLHLDRSESNRRSFVELLESWEPGPGDTSGKPYDSHQRQIASTQPVEPTAEVGSDSENSVSPALSLVSLSESESDSDIGRTLCGSDSGVNRLSVVQEKEKGTLFRAVSYLKSIDSESSSDEQRPIISPPVTYKDRRSPSVTDLDLSVLEHTDSLDELKVCDPFYAGDARDSQSPSNTSSGFCSVQVSSSETNSVQESPREAGKQSLSSFTSSRSSGYSTGSARSSMDNKSQTLPTKLKVPGKLNSHREASEGRQKLPKHDEPYEWDRSSSELEDLESEGSSYNPKVFENLLDLQRRLGVDLEDTDSSRGSLDKLSTSELLKYSPPTSPTKYKVDKLSDAEKDERCSKLMREYKTTQKIKSAIAAGSSVYRTWVL